MKNNFATILNSVPLIIIPTMNEKKNLKILLDELLKLSINPDILIVDDNSIDGTIALVKSHVEFMKRMFILERKGKKPGLGASYVDGFKWALDKKYEYILEMDGDYSHRPQYIERMLHFLLKQDLDIVIGSRYINGVSVINWPLQRLIISYYANRYAKLILGTRINDMTSGFVVYKRHALESIDLNRIMSKGYSFQIELKYKLLLKKNKIGEFPIIFYERENGVSKLSRSIVIESFFNVIYFRILSLFRSLL